MSSSLSMLQESQDKCAPKIIRSIDEPKIPIGLRKLIKWTKCPRLEFVPNESAEILNDKAKEKLSLRRCRIKLLFQNNL